MNLSKNTADLSGHLKRARDKGKTIGFVPTMGALHAGHIALIKAARQQNQVTVASIFVNPAQFNDKKDFDKYPVTIEKDIELLVVAGCDVLFWPAATEIYPDGYDGPTAYDLGYLGTILEGKYRPGHFQGVCKVMNRLLDIVEPDNLYMGQKDYQQCMVVKRLLTIMPSPAILHTCPTLRAADGLAMSSRNIRLSATERENAPAIFKVLNYIKNNLQAGPLAGIIQQSTVRLEQHHFKIDYVAIADAATLEPVTNWNGKQKLVALVAAFQQEVRLIDNLLLY